MEQLAIEKSEMFRKGIVTLDSAIDTPEEAQRKAKAAAVRIAAEEAEEAKKGKNTKK